MLELALGGALAMHIWIYREYLAKIIVVFCITFIMKKILQGSGEKTKADLLGLGGYCVTGANIFYYIQAVINNGIR